MSELLDAFRNASKEEQMMFAAAISGQQGTTSEVYAAMKLIEQEKAQAAAKQAECDRGERLRQDSAEKARKMFPFT